MNIEARVLERIEREFSLPDRPIVVELLQGYSGPEGVRVTWDILQLSKGNLESVRRYLQAAQRDYRDVLYWTEYYESDPLLKGRDPKQIVEDIAARWGNKP